MNSLQKIFSYFMKLLNWILFNGIDMFITIKWSLQCHWFFVRHKIKHESPCSFFPKVAYPKFATFKTKFITNLTHYPRKHPCLNIIYSFASIHKTSELTTMSMKIKEIFNFISLKNQIIYHFLYSAYDGIKRLINWFIPFSINIWANNITTWIAIYNPIYINHRNYFK
jgi:hypothetical protein